MSIEFARQDIISFRPGDEDYHSRKNAIKVAFSTYARSRVVNRDKIYQPRLGCFCSPDQGPQVGLDPAPAVDTDAGTLGLTRVLPDQFEQNSKAKDKTSKQSTKKQKESPISLGDQLLRDKIITSEQLEQSLAQQERTGESLVRILVRSGCVRLPQLGPYVKIGELRKFAVLDLENDYYQGTLRIMLIHRRNFRLFLGVCAVTILAAVWFYDQIQVFGYLCALAALATIYHRIQRRYYDLQSFFRQTRQTVLSALDSCATVGELSMVRDNARAGFATAVPLDFQVRSSGCDDRRPLNFIGPAIVVVFVTLLLLGAIKTHGGLQLSGLSQTTTQAQQPSSVKRLNFSRSGGQ